MRPSPLGPSSSSGRISVQPPLRVAGATRGATHILRGIGVKGGRKGLTKVKSILTKVVEEIEEYTRSKREQADAEARSIEMKQNRARAEEEAKRNDFLEAKKRKLADKAARAAALEKEKLEKIAKTKTSETIPLNPYNLKRRAKSWDELCW